GCLPAHANVWRAKADDGKTIAGTCGIIGEGMEYRVVVAVRRLKINYRVGLRAASKEDAKCGQCGALQYCFSFYFHRGETLVGELCPRCEQGGAPARLPRARNTPRAALAFKQEGNDCICFSDLASC